MRSLSFVIALFLFASSAHAQTRSVVVKNTPDGFVLTSVSNAPVTDAPAVLLTAHTDGSGAWSLRVLGPDENPAEVAAREPLDMVLGPNSEVAHDLRGAVRRSRVALRDAQEAMRRSRLTTRGDREERGEIIELVDVIGDGEIIDESARGVYYEVSAQMAPGFELADPLMDSLSDTPALHELTLRMDGKYVAVDMQFHFDSLDALNAWRAAGTFETLREKTRSVSETVSVR